jgi:hypothetical protein
MGQPEIEGDKLNRSTEKHWTGPHATSTSSAEAQGRVNTN